MSSGANSRSSTKMPQILELLKQDLEKQKCREDVKYFTRHYLKISEPRKGGQGTKPFDLFPKQEEYLDRMNYAYEHEEYLAVEKCRDVGATWTTLAWFMWHWLFTPGFIGLLLSRKEEEVDRSKELKPNTLFAKLDQFMRGLPDFMMPEGFDRQKHRAHMLLYNPATGASLMGESSNESVGRSSRASAVMLDEVEEGDPAIFDILLPVSPTVFPVGTVKGNAHEERIKRAKDTNQLFVFDWNDNPLHDQAWFDKMQRDMDEVTFAREILRNRSASVRGVVYKNFRDVPKGYYPYNPDLPLITFWDFGYSDETYLGFIQKDNATGLLYLIDEVVSAQMEIEWFVNFVPGCQVVPQVYLYTEEEEAQISEHQKWRKPIYTIGDPSGRQSSQLRQGSIFTVLNGYGLRPRIQSVLWQNYRQRVSAARDALKRLHVDTRCKWFTKSMENYHYPERSRVSESTSENDKPVHNWASHAATAFEAFAITEKLIPRDEFELPPELRNRVVRKNKWEFQKWA